MPTTSHPPRPSSGSNGSISQGSPLKSVQLRVTVTGAGGKDLARLAKEKGLDVKERGGKVSLVISAATPEEALAQLGRLSGILASRT